METCGIIAEYNPFHNGHRYQIARVRQTLGSNTGVIIAMSGDFVQRGGPAIVDKWTRAAWATRQGADLVIELPVWCATSSAERFAAGGVQLLDALGIVRHIAFGAETSDLSRLKAVAALLAVEDATYKAELQDALAKKTGFASARQEAVGALLGESAAALLAKSNAILAISYLVAMKRQRVTFQPLLIERVGPEENDSSSRGRFSPASFIRQCLLESLASRTPSDALSLSSALPSEVLASLITRGLNDQLNSFDRLFPHVLARLISQRADDLLTFESMRPDLAERLIKEANERILPEDAAFFIEKTATRVYPASRVRRALTDLYLDKRNLPNEPRLIRVLAFSKRGRYLLKMMKQHAALPIVTRNSDVYQLTGEARAELEASQRAADLYALLLNRHLRADFDRSVSMS